MCIRDRGSGASGCTGGCNRFTAAVKPCVPCIVCGDGSDLSVRWAVTPVSYTHLTTEEVYGFDVPVEELGKEFDLAILGTKGTWYDHKVCRSEEHTSELQSRETISYAALASSISTLSNSLFS